jgi:hypothetical protein
MSTSAPSRGLGPHACFVISLGYFTAVALVAFWYLHHGRHIDGIEDRWRIIEIAWAGSLGAVMASLAEIRQNVAKWNPHQATWYVARPFVGAVFGGIGYLIYIAIVEASVATTGTANVRPEPTILGYVIAFTLGYREETFRELLKRVTELLVSAGGGDVEPPSAPAELLLSDEVSSHGDVTLQWRPSTDNVGVIGYNVYRDRWFLATVRVERDAYAPRLDQSTRVTQDQPESNLEQSVDKRPRAPEWVTFVDRAVDPSEIHLYSVTAFDRAGNESDPAGPIRVRLADKPRSAGEGGTSAAPSPN